VAQLLLRFFEPDEGNIFINNIKIDELALHSLRNGISYVPQDVFLFSDTISNNIQFGLNEKQPIEEIARVAKYASIQNEIEELPNGYQTAVGERGVTLSGGQKQRISIARALIKESNILLLDDCLSAVDSKTEHQIEQNLSAYFYKQNCNCYKPSHIQLFFIFDNIIVMEDGTVTEQGTHAQLLARNGEYAELYKMQGHREDGTVEK